MSCLDVGCGPGAVMRLMADRVGAEGRVVGGSSTAGAFEAAGLGTPDETDAAVHYLPLSQMANMLIGVYDSLYAAGAELGLADPERASAFREDMADAATDGRYYCLTPVLVAAWKRIG